MSAQGRGREKNKNDNYSTPSFCTQAIMRRLNPTGLILEPCAGNGQVIIDAQSQNRIWHANELREGAFDSLKKLYEEHKLESFIISDFLTNNTWIPNHVPDNYDYVITNPPYTFAEEFIKRSLPLAPICIFLLRLNFLEGIERSEWQRNHMPDIFVLPKRPNFLKGQTNPENGKPYGGDATGYGWFQYFRHERKVGLVEILEV